MDERIESGGIGSRKRSRESSSSPSPPPLFEISLEPDPFVNEPHKRGPYISYTYLDPSPSNPHAILSILGDPEEILPTSTSSRSCFNCSSIDHNSSACPEPKNQKLISINRLKFQAENPQTGDGGRLSGVDTERSKMLTYAETYKAGVVSSDLRYALGFDKAVTEGEIVDYPWFNRFLDYGYPLGWTVKEGGIDPFEAVKDKIGRDLNFDDVELLQTFTGDDEEELEDITINNFETSIASQASSTINDIPLPPTSPPPPLPPLPPPGTPPPLPSNPPPPLPPVRLIDYPTTLFNSQLLSIHQPGYLLPRNNSNSLPQHFPHSNSYTPNFRQHTRTQVFYSPRSIPIPPSSPFPDIPPPPPPPAKKQKVEVEKLEELEESESEMEMEISSGEES